MRETERRTVNVFAVPYDSGHREARMGRGPGALLLGGLEGALRAPGREIRIDVIEAAGCFHAENATAFELMRLTSERVREAAGSGFSSLVLSGNCNASVGTVAGLGPEQIGVVWFDGRADFNTPQTSRSAFWTGWGSPSLSVTVGRLWPTRYLASSRSRKTTWSSSEPATSVRRNGSGWHTRASR
jgi:arginase